MLRFVLIPVLTLSMASCDKETSGDKGNKAAGAAKGGGASADILQYAPTGANLIVYLDQEKLRSSKVGAALKSMIENESEFGELKDKCGFDIWNQVNSAMIAAAFTESEAVTVIAGISKSDWLACAPKLDYTVSGDTATKGSFTMNFPADNVVAITEGGAKLGTMPGPLAEHFSKTYAGGAVWVGAQNVPEDQDSMIPTPEFKEVTVNIKAGDSLDVDGKVQFAESAEAAEINMMLSVGISEIRSEPIAAPYLDAIKISQNGDTINFEASLSQELIQNIGELEKVF